jgi:hypothetical protein
MSDFVACAMTLATENALLLCVLCSEGKTQLVQKRFKVAQQNRPCKALLK